MTKLWPLLCIPIAACIIVDDDDGGGGGNNFCGDAVVTGTEQCDDGNSVSGDGCTGCVIDTPSGNALITANWTFRNEATNTATGCPSGFDTAAVYSQQVDANGNNVGAPIIDLFDCVDGTGTTAPLTPATYITWIEITNTNNTSTYAQSTSAYVDLTTGNKTFSAQILNDGGYFQLAWTLRGDTSNNVLTCAQAGAAGGVSTIGTEVGNATNSNEDIFDCIDGSGITAGYVAGTYTVSIAALNASDAAVGTAPALTNRVIQTANRVTNLGTIEIPIDGL